MWLGGPVARCSLVYISVIRGYMLCLFDKLRGWASPNKNGGVKMKMGVVRGRVQEEEGFFMSIGIYISL